MLSGRCIDNGECHCIVFQLEALEVHKKDTQTAVKAAEIVAWVLQPYSLCSSHSDWSPT